jgi:hypothetical protein
MNKLEALASVGCIDAEWYLRDHIPRHASFYNLDQDESYRQVFDEHRVLYGIQQVNFREMLNTGTAHRALRLFKEWGVLGQVGENMLGVQDHHYYRFIKDEITEKVTWFDPDMPLSIAVISDMNDYHKVSAMVGRPNIAEGLVLFNGFTQQDYDVVVNGVHRIQKAKKDGDLPHLMSNLTEIYIPYTLGNVDHPYDPEHFELAGPLEYTSLAID